MKEILFTDFLHILQPSEIPLATLINDLFLQSGCTSQIKEAANGFSVSYLSGVTKKTLASFVCRKTGVKIRLTPQKPFSCDDILNTLPENMKKDIIRATVCKRLSDPALCNPRCSMGYAFSLDGENYKKCRSMAFLFSVTEENLPYTEKLIQKCLGK